jgi:hypothetical protein
VIGDATKLPMTEDEFFAELLRRFPDLKEDVLPDGTRIIRGIRLKTPEELGLAKARKQRHTNQRR